MKRIVSMLVVLAMALSLVPAMAQETAVTRAYAVHCFVEAVGEENFSSAAVSLDGFSDGREVPAEYRDSLGLAVANGIIRGSGDNTLRPNEELTRIEAIIILGRCLPEIEEKRPSTEFTDVPAWAEAEIDRLYRGGIVNGYGGGVLGSNDLISEEQLKLLTERVENAFPGEISLKDDFYAAINKDFLENAVIPEGQHMVSPSSELSDEVDEYMVQRSEELVRLDSEGKASSIQSAAARFYQLALKDEEDISLKPIQKYLDMIDECEDYIHISCASGVILRDLEVPVFFDASVPSRRTAAGGIMMLGGIYVDFLGTGIERTYWEVNPENTSEAYSDYAEKILSFLGVRNSRYYAQEITAMHREIALAGKSFSQQMSTSDEDEEEESVFDWEGLCNKYPRESNNPVARMIGCLDVYDYMKWQAYIISDVAAMDKAVELMKGAEIETLRAMCKVNLITQLMDFMPSTCRSARREMTAKVTGIETLSNDTVRAAALTAAVYPELYEPGYAERAGESDIRYLSELIDDILAVFEEKFGRSIHISPESGVKGVGKLGRMGKHIGEVRSEEQNKFHVVKDKTDLLENGVQILEKGGGTVYSAVILIDSTMPCYTVNASYGPYTNSINIYTGMIQSPYYSPDNSDEENLGGIGTILAHEISHAFDEMGSNYDEKGNYDPWWSDRDIEHFKEFAGKIKAYYSRYENSYCQTVNGELTVNENIADILAMECIIEVAKRKNLDLDKVFRAYASIWASACTPEYADYLLRYDTHSPDKVRVNAVLSNFEEFYELYGIKEGDGMYVPPEERVKFF